MYIINLASMQKIDQDIEYWLNQMLVNPLNPEKPEMVLLEDSYSNNQQQQLPGAIRQTPPIDAFDFQGSSRGSQAYFEKSSGQPAHKEARTLKGYKKIQHKGCGCKKSLCIKSYCKCYSEGVSCSFDCCCLNCSNKQVSRMIDNQKPPKNNEISPDGCSCSKTSCLKNYCECFRLSKKCSSACKCRNCRNLWEPAGGQGHTQGLFDQQFRQSNDQHNV